MTSENKGADPTRERLHEAVWLRSKKRSGKVKAGVLGILGIAIAFAVLTGNAHEAPAPAGLGQAAESR